MPLLDSFKVDHTIMNAPGVRLAKTMKTPKGDEISVFDLRFCKPNIEIMSERGTHTLEQQLRTAAGAGHAGGLYIGREGIGLARLNGTGGVIGSPDTVCRAVLRAGDL